MFTPGSVPIVMLSSAFARIAFLIDCIYNWSMAIKLQQRQLQKQVQVLGQKQIRSLNILSMSTQDLVAELRKNAEENPSLIIDDSSSRINGFYDGTRISSSSAEGEIA